MTWGRGSHCVGRIPPPNCTQKNVDAVGTGVGRPPSTYRLQRRFPIGRSRVARDAPSTGVPAIQDATERKAGLSLTSICRSCEGGKRVRAQRRRARRCVRIERQIGRQRVNVTAVATLWRTRLRRLPLQRRPIVGSLAHAVLALPRPLGAGAIPSRRNLRLNCTGSRRFSEPRAGLPRPRRPCRARRPIQYRRERRRQPSFLRLCLARNSRRNA
jgi:hypothetical protein